MHSEHGHEAWKTPSPLRASSQTYLSEIDLKQNQRMSILWAEVAAASYLAMQRAVWRWPGEREDVGESKDLLKMDSVIW